MLFYQKPGWAVRFDMLLPSSLPSSSTLPEKPTINTHWKLLYQGRYELDRRWFGLQTRLPGHPENARFRPIVSRLRGHTDSVYCCCIDHGYDSGHLGYIISGSRDQTLRVWDSATGQGVATLYGHRGSVLCVYQHAGMLVSGSSDATARVWLRVHTGAEHYTPSMVLRGHTAGVLDIAFDAAYIVTASRDTTLRVWKRSDGALVHVYRGHSSSVNACSIQHGHVASGSGDGSIHIWDIATGETRRIIHGPHCGIASIVFAGDRVFSGSSDRAIRMWSVSTGTCSAAFSAHAKLVRAIAYDPMRQLLASGGWDRKTRLWDIAPLYTAERGHKKAQLTLELGIHQARIFDVALDTTRLISACEDNTLWITDYGKQGIPSHVYA